MNRFVVLLRGINVSGHKKIKMADLKVLLEKAGFCQVKTYIQSGNVLLESEEGNASKLARVIEQLLEDNYGFFVPTLVISPQEVRRIVDANPFETEEKKQATYLTLLEEQPTADKVEKLKEYLFDGEEYVLEKQVIYFYSANPYGKAKMNNNFFESKLKVKATTRNWKTMNKLIELSKIDQLT